MKQILPAAAMALIASAAQAQTYRDSSGTVVPGVVPIQPGVGPLFTPSNPGNVAGTFSASLGGFTPTPSYAQLAFSDTASHRVAVPTGAVDIVYNTSANVAYCTFGNSSVAATVSSDVIQANSWVAFTVPAGATNIACLSPAGTLAINVSGGSGLPTGSGGGGGAGGGSNASVGSTGSSGPSAATQMGMLVGGNLTAIPGTTYGLTVDTNSNSQLATLLQNGTGTFGLTYPAAGVATGAKGSGTINPIIQADTSASINVLGATTGTVIQAGVTGKSIYVTGWEFISAGAVTTNFSIFYSTFAAACSSSAGSIAGPWTLTSSSPGEVFGGGLGSVAVVPAGDTLCASNSGATAVGGHVSLTQF